MSDQGPGSLAVGPGRLLVISGPSGVGKDTVLKKLFELYPNMRYSVSYTTRAPRAGEVNGRDYWFVDEETFARMEKEGEFLESFQVHANWYGTALVQVNEAVEQGEVLALIIDVQGAFAVKQKVGNATFVFLAPPSFEVLQERIQARDGTNPKDLELRLTNARRELEAASWFDHRVVNDDADEAAKKILAILKSDKLLHA